MHQGNLIVDGVAHIYNNSLETVRNDIGEELVRGVFKRHSGVYRPDDEHYIDDPDQFLKEWQAEEVARLLFLESDIDFAVFHTVPLPGWIEGGHSPLRQGLKLREEAPGRVAIYGAADPYADDTMEQMERQVEKYDVDGFKIYPSRYKDGQNLKVSLDDPETGRAILEKARELEVGNIGVHKAIPLANTPAQYVKFDDLYNVVEEFDDLTFEVVHVGFSFLEDAVPLVAKYDNVYANLESTAALIYRQPGRVAETLGELLTWAGPEKLVFSSGALLTHPQLLVEEFWDFQIPERMREEYGYPELTDDIKRQLLGENALRMLDKDPDVLRETVADDHWERRKEEEGRPEPWSTVEQ